MMMLIATNDIPRLKQLIAVALRRGSSAQAIVAQIGRAIDGLYSPRGGFTPTDLDIAHLVKGIGGRRLLYTLNKSKGLASESTLRRHSTPPKLLASVGVPSSDEISCNISSFFNPSVKPTPATINGCIPGNILAFDGIAIESKCRYCPSRRVIMGLCREHSRNFNPNVEGPQTLDNLWDLLKDKKVCWGVDATVVAVAPYARSDYYAPIPIVLSPSDKTEKSEALMHWIQTVIDSWQSHDNGKKMFGELWSIASDGDATFRRARHGICTKIPLDPHSDLGVKLVGLQGLNCYTSKELITATCDPKHIFKREWYSKLCFLSNIYSQVLLHCFAAAQELSLKTH